MIHLCSQFQRSLLDGLLKVGEIEYTHIGLKSIGVGWVKPCCLQAISWLSRIVPCSRRGRLTVLANELAPCPWGAELQQPGVCMTFMWKKLDQGMILLWSRVLALFIFCRSRICSARVPGHWCCALDREFCRARGQGLNLSSEISCVDTSELKALYQGWGLDKHCLTMISFCRIVIFSLCLKILFVLCKWCLDLQRPPLTLFAFEGCSKVSRPWQKKNPCIFVWEVTQGRLSVELGLWRAEWKYL